MVSPLFYNKVLTSSSVEYLSYAISVKVPGYLLFGWTPDTSNLKQFIKKLRKFKCHDHMFSVKMYTASKYKNLVIDSFTTVTTVCRQTKHNKVLYEIGIQL